MLSIVIPVFNEEKNIEPLFLSLKAALSHLEEPWEAIFVDDGSKDKTPQVLKNLSGSNSSQVTYIRLSRNFGQSAALASGIDYARGEIIATMDGDGQNDPKDIPSMLKILKDDYDVVCGWRRSRKDPLLRVIASRFANRVVNSITGVRLHDYGCTLRLYRRSIVQEMQIMGDMHRLLPAYLVWRGANVTEMQVGHHPRISGHSKYSILPRTFKVLLDAFLLHFYFSYFTRPMHFFGSAAFGCMGGAFLIECFVVGRKVFWGGEWISPLFFMGLFFGSLSIFFLFMGALADLIVRHYALARQLKPYHIAVLIQDGSRRVL